MNYKKVYKEMFSIQNYNSDHSVSYSLATKFLKEIESTNEISTISDLGSGKGHLIKRLPTEKKIYSYDFKNSKRISYGGYRFSLAQRNQSSRQYVWW